MVVDFPLLDAFVKLGSFIQGFCKHYAAPVSEADIAFKNTLCFTMEQDAWFTEEDILFALRQWAELLTSENLTQWLSRYTKFKDYTPKTVCVVMTENIPLVSFHDFLCVLLAGHTVVARLSSQNRVLLAFFSRYLREQEPSLAEKIHFVNGRLDHFDAVIATVSGNSSEYFERYFSKKPNIIRKNRNTVAVLTGTESETQLVALGEDVFRYYGLGFRNVSKIYVPGGYDFDAFFNALDLYSGSRYNHKYANSYDYNKAVYLMSSFKILDNGFLLLKEDEGFSSPIAVLFYEYYDSQVALCQQLKERKEFLQGVVSEGVFSNEIAFGETQRPQLHDYAGGVDTMEFLLRI